MEELKTAKEVAKILGVSDQRIWELCRTDASFPKVTLGERTYRFSLSALQRWAENGGTRPEDENHEKS